MKRSITPVAVLVIAAACGAKSAGSAAIPDPAARAAREAADSTRGDKLAVALKSGAPVPKPVPNTYNLKFEPDAVRAGVAGAAIVAFVVLPNGRVDRESRTLVYVKGHQIYAKNVCDALLAARFEPAPPDTRGVLGVMPVFFSIQGSASRDSARQNFAQTQRVMSRRFGTMTQDEARVWFAMRPTCSAIKIGINPLYGPPPQ